MELRTGHLPMVERPEEWQKPITTFLAQHNAGAIRRAPGGACVLPEADAATRFT
ncbi:hypothetical protein [Streptomyces sp. NPDC048357]|uniref:hypothetical protein n=1 Tax=Streptomyces sp. NPDC048357 TaxID=3154719 RepID=UPI00344744C9